MDYGFCNSQNQLLNNISSMLSEKLFTSIPESLIKERYQEMIDNFNVPFKKWEGKKNYSYASNGDMAIPTVNIKDQTLTGVKNIGIDFPTWFNFSTDKRVMLVGMEPRRRYDFADHATISSPFGLHHFNNKKNPSRNLLYNFVYTLSENNFSSYFTDISKIYCIKNNKKYTGETSLSDKIFGEELKIVNPTYIITFGKSSTERVEKCLERTGNKISADLIPLAHPAAFGGNKRYYDYFISQIEK